MPLRYLDAIQRVLDSVQKTSKLVSKDRERAVVVNAIYFTLLCILHSVLSSDWDWDLGPDPWNLGPGTWDLGPGT